VAHAGGQNLPQQRQPKRQRPGVETVLRRFLGFYWVKMLFALVDNAPDFAFFD